MMGVYSSYAQQQQHIIISITLLLAGCSFLVPPAHVLLLASAVSTQRPAAVVVHYVDFLLEEEAGAPHLSRTTTTRWWCAAQGEEAEAILSQDIGSGPSASVIGSVVKIPSSDEQWGKLQVPIMNSGEAHNAIDATNLSDEEKGKLHAHIIQKRLDINELYAGMTYHTWKALLLPTAPVDRYRSHKLEVFKEDLIICIHCGKTRGSLQAGFCPSNPL